MTNEALLDEVLTDYYDAYLSRFDDVAEHRFSLRHRLKMRKIFKLYEKNVRKLNLMPDVQQHKISRVRFNRKTVLAIVAIVLLSVIAGCAVAYFVSESFRGTVHDDNTQLFAINVDGAPTTIEYTYYLSDPPRGFKLLETDISDYDAYSNYANNDTGEYIIIFQYVKIKYDPHFNTENKKLTKIDFNGHEAVILEMSNSSEDSFILVLDNGDYILEIITNCSKEIFQNIAKTLNRNYS